MKGRIAIRSALTANGTHFVVSRHAAPRCYAGRAMSEDHGKKMHVSYTEAQREA